MSQYPHYCLDLSFTDTDRKIAQVQTTLADLNEEEPDVLTHLWLAELHDKRSWFDGEES